MYTVNMAFVLRRLINDGLMKSIRIGQSFDTPPSIGDTDFGSCLCEDKKPDEEKKPDEDEIDSDSDSNATVTTDELVQLTKSIIDEMRAGTKNACNKA